MGHRMEDIRKERGERAALHARGNRTIVPAAAAAARAIFDACGGADGWKHWIVADGKLVKMAIGVLIAYIDDRPDATAQAAYRDLREFPGFVDDVVTWEQAPASVRGAYEAFRSVYLQLWGVARGHSETLALALPPRPLRVVQTERYLPKLSGADVAELRAKLTQLGYSEREIRYRLMDPCFNLQNRAAVLEDAEEDAYYRAWCTEQAKTDPGSFPSFPEHELSPERPYLQAVYQKWDAYYANLKTPAARGGRR